MLLNKGNYILNLPIADVLLVLWKNTSTGEEDKAALDDLKSFKKERDDKITITTLKESQITKKLNELDTTTQKAQRKDRTYPCTQCPTHNVMLSLSDKEVPGVPQLGLWPPAMTARAAARGTQQ